MEISIDYDHGIATIAGLAQFSSPLPCVSFIALECDKASKSDTAAIPGTLFAISLFWPKMISEGTVFFLLFESD